MCRGLHLRLKTPLWAGNTKSLVAGALSFRRKLTAYCVVLPPKWIVATGFRSWNLVEVCTHDSRVLASVTERLLWNRALNRRTVQMYGSCLNNRYVCILTWIILVYTKKCVYRYICIQSFCIQFSSIHSLGFQQHAVAERLAASRSTQFSGRRQLEQSRDGALEGHTCMWAAFWFWISKWNFEFASMYTDHFALILQQGTCILQDIDPRPVSELYIARNWNVRRTSPQTLSVSILPCHRTSTPSVGYRTAHSIPNSSWKFYTML